MVAALQGANARLREQNAELPAEKAAHLTCDVALHALLMLAVNQLNARSDCFPKVLNQP